MALMEVGLDDKYRLDAKRIFLSGTRRWSGCRCCSANAIARRVSRPQASSPAIAARRSACTTTRCGGPSPSCKQHDIAFVPGLNEDLAATAVWGSQQVGLFPGAKVDGVFGIWYGKGPGVDRSMDALKHANSAGTSRNGGVIALAGDDHGCQSSTLAHQSEQVFAAALMPVLNPATLQDYLDLGILGFALSRYSGCWVGFKAISRDGRKLGIDLQRSRSRSRSSCPRFRDAAGRALHPLAGPAAGAGAAAAWPEDGGGRRLRARQPASTASCSTAKPARLGIIATGKAYLDLRQALADLGITDATRRHWACASTRSR